MGWGLLLKLGLNFVKKFWPYILVALILIGVYFYWHHLTSTIEKQAATIQQQKEVISALEQKIKTCEANFAGVKGSLDTQNKALADLAELGKLNKAQWDQLYSKINTENAALNAQLQNILKDPKPQSCEAAIKYLLDARREYVK